MMSSKVLLTLAVVFLAMLAISEGMSLGGEQHCRCIEKQQGRMSEPIRMVSIIVPNSHCDNTEIIATLRDGRKVCLDPEALWVKKMIAKLEAQKKKNTAHQKST